MIVQNEKRVIEDSLLFGKMQCAENKNISAKIAYSI
jgi:hypothetical protein